MTPLSWLLIYAHLAKSIEIMFLVFASAFVVWGIINLCLASSCEDDARRSSSDDKAKHTSKVQYYYKAAIAKLIGILVCLCIAIFSPSSTTVLRIGGIEAVATLLDSKPGRELSDDTVELVKKFLKAQIRSIEEKR